MHEQTVILQMTEAEARLIGVMIRAFIDRETVRHVSGETTRYEFEARLTAAEAIADRIGQTVRAA